MHPSTLRVQITQSKCKLDPDMCNLDPQFMAWKINYEDSKISHFIFHKQFTNYKQSS